MERFRVYEFTESGLLVQVLVYSLSLCFGEFRDMVSQPSTLDLKP